MRNEAVTKHIAVVVASAFLVGVAASKLSRVQATAGQRPADSVVRPLGLPDGTQVIACQMNTGGQTASALTGNPPIVTCSPKEAVISCSFDVVEPFDATVAELCAGKPALFRAPPITIRDSSTKELTVEWIDVGADALTIRAVRTASAAEGTVLPVWRSPARLMRVRRAGAAPVTVRGSELSGDTWTIPAPVHGGELVLVANPGDPLRPIAFELDGGLRLTLAPNAHAVAAVRGVETGTYSVRPIYAGNIAGSARPLNISTGQSTVLRFDQPATGGVSIDIDAALCAISSGVSIARIVAHERGAREDPVANLELKDRQCTSLVGGLEQGRYHVSLMTGSKRLAGEVVDVRVGEVTPTQFHQPTGALSGQITVNGKPSSYATIELERKIETNPFATRHTSSADGNGVFQFDSLEPGDYVARVRKSGIKLLGQEQDVRVDAGNSVLNWDIRGGVLKVNVTGLSVSAPFELTTTQVRPIQPGMFNASTTFAGDQNSVTIEGLASGEYTVQAQQSTPEPRRVSEATAFTIASDGDVQTVQLTLSAYDAELRIVDPMDQPIYSAQIVGPDGRQVAEHSAGRYPLSEFEPGTPLFIRAPGYGPRCKVAPSKTSTVTMQPGTTVRFVFRGFTGLMRPPGTVEWGDTDCAVPLDFHTYQVEGGGDTGERSFIVRNFVPNEFWYTLGAFDGPERRVKLTVDPDGVVRVQLRPAK